MNKNYLLATIAVILCLSCNPLKELRPAHDDLTPAVSSMTYKTYYSKRNMSRSLYSSYKKFYAMDMLMADKNEDFNPGDIRVEQMPDRRFIFGAKSISGTYELFVFEEGGVGLKNYCIISKKKKKGYDGTIVKVYLFRRPNDLDDLRAIIANKEYHIDDDK